MLELSFKRRYIANSLAVIILAMLKKKPLSGNEIISYIHSVYGVFLSPGNIYPLLHTLMVKGFVNVRLDGKSKRYAIANGRKVESFITDHLKFQKLLVKDILSYKKQK